MLTEDEDEIFEKCVDQLKSWKDLINKYLDENEREQEIGKLKNVVEGLCEVDEKLKRNQKALDRVDNHINQNEDSYNIDVDKLFEEMLNPESKSSTSNFSNNHIWKSIFQNESDIMIVEKKVKKLDNNQFDAVDDSLLCSNVFSPPIDPISKVVISNPYKNKKCKHVYEHNTIVNYIKQLRHKARCPYIGCNNNLKLQDLVEDQHLQTQITEYTSTQGNSSQDSDSD